MQYLLDSAGKYIFREDQRNHYTQAGIWKRVSHLLCLPKKISHQRSAVEAAVTWFIFSILLSHVNFFLSLNH